MMKLGPRQGHVFATLVPVSRLPCFGLSHCLAVCCAIRRREVILRTAYDAERDR